MSLFNFQRLLGKTVLVTGASAGIGAATALLFAKGGSNVILCARRAEALQSVASACASAHKESGLTQGGKFAVVQLDVSDKAQVASLWDKVPSDLRNVDILVNNAGFVLGVEQVGNINDEDIESMFATNVLGLISVTQLLIKDFKERQSGHIINLGSIAGVEPYAGGAIYTATKHAVHAFTASTMRELVSTPIREWLRPSSPIVRFRGDASAASKVYQGLDPLTATDIAEEIVWAASRPPHVNIVSTLVLPVNQASTTLNYRKPNL
ncbi:NAD(P)-binding protein [Gymnopus androsaceus JB14]|uniref:NAD(P)-binding protein n=1 Tax=Gymnopus androsaceus JB14 TaxID=1447944 RepID=A0A6A4HQU3_9AGAR|nr:NAD(P)-binding protein [Gymnopus androsaceus JB14]